MEEYRDAAAQACVTLRHEVVRAEDFGASSSTPQQTCLAGVRGAEITILILGARYGTEQATGKSATHEEYLEARDRSPVLVFIQRAVTIEPDQQAFISEVQDWSHGHFTEEFGTPEELKDAVTRGLHDMDVARAQGVSDPTEMQQRAFQSIPDPHRSYQSGHTLHLAIAGGPKQQVLRPSEIEEDSLAESLMQKAMFGPERILDPSQGTKKQLEEGRLVISQEGASITVDELGTVTLSLDWNRTGRSSGFSSLIEEDVIDQLETMASFGAAVFEEVDPMHRVSDVAVAALQTTGGFLGWKTRAEQAENPNTTMGGGSSTPSIVGLTPPTRPRAALQHEARAIAEDLMVLVRRQVRG